MTARHRRRALLAPPGAQTTSPVIAVAVATGVATVAAVVLAVCGSVGSADTGRVAPATSVPTITELLD